MSAPEAKAPAAPLTNEQKREILKVSAHKRAAEAEARKLDAEIARLELVERLERELGGPEGQQFAIFDASHLGEGLFAVKLGDAILMRNFLDSKMNDVDRCDFVAPCIVHPTKEVYLAARGRRPGIDIVLANLLAGLYGLEVKANEGK